MAKPLRTEIKMVDVGGKLIPATEADRRDLVIVRAVKEGKSAAEACREAGYGQTTCTTSRAGVVVRRAMKRSPFIDALDEVGVTREKLALKLSEGLEAMTPTMRLKDGTTIEGGDDHRTRLGFLKTALEYRGEAPDTREEGTSVETHEQRVLRLRGIAAPPPQYLPEE